MATTSTVKSDWLANYEGFDEKEVGLGIQRNLYATPEYAKRKTQKLLIGGLTRILYSGFEHDTTPLLLSIGYISKYNVIIGYNLRYLPEKQRKLVIDFVIKTNKANIKNKKPITVDYYALKRAIPISTQVVRMYKLIGIRVLENVPLRDWQTVIKETSKWSRHYKKQKVKGNAFDKFIRSITGFFGR